MTESKAKSDVCRETLRRNQKTCLSTHVLHLEFSVLLIIVSISMLWSVAAKIGLF